MIKRILIAFLAAGVIAISGCSKKEDAVINNDKEVEIENTEKETEVSEESAEEAVSGEFLEEEFFEEEVSEEETEETLEGEIEETEEISSEEVQEEIVEEKKRIAAFVKGADITSGKVYIDEIEWLTIEEDLARLEELEIDAESLPNGYYINNPYNRIDEYVIREDAVFKNIDYSTAEAYTVTEEEWYENILAYSLYWFRITNGEVVMIEEQYLP